MKNTYLILAVLFIFNASAVNAQAKKYKTEGKKCVRVEITDPGELYSTYELMDEEVELMKIEGVKPFLLEQIKNNHKEDSWPSKMAQLDARVDNPDKIKTYNVYKVCKLQDKYILVIPAKYNKEAGDGWAPTKDIYIVIGETGVKE